MSTSTPSSVITVERMTHATLDLLLPLIAAYQQFYGVSPNIERNHRHFSALIDHPEDGTQWLAFADGITVGFATIYIAKSSLSAGTCCILNDLYTTPETRGRGIARALIAACSDYAASQGYASLEWVTQISNVGALRLYDRLATEKSTWVHYTLKTD